MKKGIRGKVIVGMSGGVDSSVTAALLQKQGFEVVGIFLHFWKEPSADNSRENVCCSLAAQEEARKVAKTLKIPFYVSNVAKEFKKEVVDYFIREYKNGHTPNPCVICNKEIKFRFLLKKMLELEADQVATGHYARIVRKIRNPKSEIRNKSKFPKANAQKFVYKLSEAQDKAKDQSYFLYTLNQQRLGRIMLPLGEYTKKEVRALAQKFKLPVYQKPESQDICFIADGTANFLARQIKMQPGRILNEKKEVLGKHQGLPLYTLGQRKGIGVGGPGPYFVVGKNAKKNELQVTNQKDNPALLFRSIRVKNLRWTDEIPKFPFSALVRTRYQSPKISAIIKKTKTQGEMEVFFSQPQWAVAPGQAAVFYNSVGEVLGGGTIK